MVNLWAINHGPFSVKFKIVEFDESSLTGVKRKNPVPRSPEGVRRTRCRPMVRRCTGLVIVAEVFMSTVAESQAKRIGARESS
jgi:hypothetical protein